ncbi:putative nuclease HARBI1 [Cucumis melo var. makuwa]|uniref:Putative nuclease HARBI1 n=1 Tax=Cucumis melo var. makuwa TaxID=1194695 RepID=A0A5D3DGX5_CUCMM|nr:putative nuclease HARBI1 [Cucumis melo var. makuwa]
MNQRCFAILCHLVRAIAGLTSTQVVDVEEMVAMFLHILAYDVKNRVIQWKFMRSGVLDGTYIKVNVPVSNRARYRTRKGEVATNVLGMYDTKGDFVYILVGWEGSAADSRILRDAISRPNGLKVPKGYYYLVDAGYPNAEGFLTPYRGQRYHLQEWCGAENAPSTSKELFNMKHSSARNVIERAFVVLKGRWVILQGKSYYPVEVHCCTLFACCFLHNLINKEMTTFNIQDDIDEVDSTHVTSTADDIHYIEVSNEWARWRDDLAEEMFSDWELRN